MDILLAVIFTLLGLAVGSFLNVLIDRLPRKASLVSPPSHCDACQHRLAPADLIPLFSYLWRRGRCRYCGAPIPRRVPLVELAGGGVFLLAFWRFVLSPGQGNEVSYAAFILAAFWSCVFLVIIFIDWEHKLILNRVTYPAALLALVILGLDTAFPGWGMLAHLNYFDSGFLSISIVNGLIAGAGGLAFFLIIHLIIPAGMGMGDVKLAGLIGLVFGFPLVIVALLLGIFIGGLAAVVMLSSGKKGRKDVVAYGTFLGIGPIVTLLWGNEILSWYLGFF
jgi:leader peptidase (prepilin peptidase)/N-methyltransferase